MANTRKAACGGATAAVMLTAVAGLLASAPARACEQYYAFGLVVPSWDATAVPLNVEPILAIRSAGAASASLCESGATADQPSVAGELLRLDATFSRLVPRELLRPSTTYEVRASSDCSGFSLGSFTTGTGEDTTPPAFPGVTAVIEDRYQPSMDNPCGSSAYDFYRLDMPTPVDPEGGERNVMLLVYEGPSPDTVDLGTPSMVLESWKRELTGKLSPEVRDNVAVVVTALDWAGNESAQQVPVVAQNRACGCQGGGSGAMAALALLLLPALTRRSPWFFRRAEARPWK